MTIPQKSASPDGTQVFAANYDRTFTHTLVGSYQRERVWQVLERYITTEQPLKILELNGGTGTDAVYLAQRGHTVLCTDMSSEMLRVGALKKAKLAPTANLRFQPLNINHLHQLPPNDKYDLVFSNFGGLNCLSPSELSQLARRLPAILQPDGVFVAVIMPQYCLLERLYFLLKFRLKRTFAHKGKTPTAVAVNGQWVDTYFYNATAFYGYFKTNFRQEQVSLIGLVPSYLNPFFVKNRRLLHIIKTLENKLITHGRGATIADHYLIALSLK